MTYFDTLIYRICAMICLLWQMIFKQGKKTVELWGLRDLYRVIPGAGHFEEFKLGQLLKVPHLVSD